LKIADTVRAAALASSAVALLLAAGLGNAAEEAGLSPSEIRGRSIYRQGESVSARPIMAAVGADTEIEAKLVPCSSCHGSDGRGRPEGTVLPPNIRWEGLTNPSPVAIAGRERAAYDEALLVRAITMGFDSKGNRLNANMPRYALTRSDAADLVAYLKKLSADHDPGLSDDSIRIGALLPPPSKYPDLSSAIQSALTAYFTELNQSGGLYGRHVELLCRELPADPEKVAPAVRQFLEYEDIFALVASFLAGEEKPSTAVLEDLRVPLVGAWTLIPDNQRSVNSPIFYLDPGLPGQSESLAAFAIQKYAWTSASLVIVVSDDELSHVAGEAVRSKLKGSLWPNAEEVPGPEEASNADALAEKLAAAKVKVLFLALREPQLVALIGALQRRAWSPVLLIPGAFYTDASELRSFPGQVFVAVSSLPSDANSEASAEYKRLASIYGLPARRVSAQYTALSEASILTEGMKRAGRELSRENLVESLEGLYDFPTGFGPPVSFSQARHIGITQLHIMRVDHMTGSLIEVNRKQ
jgi:ABC-type branched-subunit amino acid transport system substrate-binding protein